MSDKKNKNQRSRTGLPLLTDDDDLREIFTGEKPEKQSEDTFSEMLESSLSGKNSQSALLEKRAGIFYDKALTTGEKIKLYPSPEEEIDLHGCSSGEAENKISTFICAAHLKGIHTLRIIVGKGLHSTTGRAVLPDVIEKKLVDLKKKKSILTFKWEKNSKLKSGALIVYLM